MMQKRPASGCQPGAMTLNAVLRWLGLPARAQDIALSSVATDSRLLKAGALFLALPGQSSDGADHIDAALAAGAAAVLAPAPLRVADPGTVPVIAVEALAQRAGGLLDFWFGSPSRALRLVGVTGTNGKTSTVCCIASLLERLDSGCGIMGTLGQGRWGELESGLNTTPDLLGCHSFVARMQAAGLEWLAMEVSSHGLDQGRIDGLAINTAVFTNLSRDHLDYHASMEAYAEAKAGLFQSPGLRYALINRDDPWSAFMCARVPPTVQCLTFSLQDPKADICLDSVVCDNSGGRGWLRTPWGEGALQTRLLGRFNLYNLVAALGVLACAGQPLAALLEQVPAIEAPPGRMDLYGGGLLPQVLVDYAHTPAALEQVLQVAREQATGRLVCVVGCGGGRDTGKRVPMARAACRLADQVFLTTDNPRFESPTAIVEQMLAGLDAEERARARPLVDRALAIEESIAVADAGDTVLVAGKGHENYQEVCGVRHPFSDVEHIRQALARRTR